MDSADFSGWVAGCRPQDSEEGGSAYCAWQHTHPPPKSAEPAFPFDVQASLRRLDSFALGTPRLGNAGGADSGGEMAGLPHRNGHTPFPHIPAAPTVEPYTRNPTAPMPSTALAQPLKWKSKGNPKNHPSLLFAFSEASTQTVYPRNLPKATPSAALASALRLTGRHGRHDPVTAPIPRRLPKNGIRKPCRHAMGKGGNPSKGYARRPTLAARRGRCHASAPPRATPRPRDSRRESPRPAATCPDGRAPASPAPRSEAL